MRRAPTQRPSVQRALNLFVLAIGKWIEVCINQSATRIIAPRALRQESRQRRRMPIGSQLHLSFLMYHIKIVLKAPFSICAADLHNVIGLG
jgi:hypothetical protein